MNIIKITSYLFILGYFFIFPNPIFASANDVVINEIQIDSTDETGGTSDDFIELYNPTDSDIYLGNYQESYLRLVKRTETGTSDASIKSWNGDSEAKIPAHGFYLWANSGYTGINITPDTTTSATISANNGIALRLGPMDTGLIIDSLGWGDCQNEFVEGSAATTLLGGQSLERQPTGYDSNNNSTDFIIQNVPNPQNSSEQETIPEDNGEDSSIESTTSGTAAPTPVNNPPTANAGTDITALINQEIIFDGSLSSDSNNDSLSYFWNFGDGATDTEQISKHTYLYPGQYIVSLLVGDGEFSDLDIITVNIYNQSIIISEFLPNPEGKDQENEWIELFNQSSQIANLTNWRLDDQDGGSSPFVFPINSLIGPNQFLVLIRPITNIALNNDNDQVRLIYPDGSLATEISYLAEKKEGFSIAFDGINYFWTKMLTPGSANIISSSGLDTETENLSKNNPEPVIQQSQDIPDVVVNTNLNQSQSFDASNPLTEPKTCLLDSCLLEENNKPGEINSVIGDDDLENFTASLSNSTKSNKKSKLILYLSIIISGSLLLSWIIIQVKKKQTLP